MYYIIPVLLIIIGLLLKLFPSEYNDSSIGIRLPLARKSKENWIEAQTYGGGVFIILGIIDIPVFYLVQNIFTYDKQEVFTVIDLLCIVIIAIVFINKHLEKWEER